MVQSDDLRGRLEHEYMVDEGFTKDTMGFNIFHFILVETYFVLRRQSSNVVE